MSKATPGPWVARPDPNAYLQDDWCVSVGDSLENIDKVAVCRERDARLIAAAPDLLEALELCRKELYEWMRDHGQDIATQQAMSKARAAIAKATGGEV